MKSEFSSSSVEMSNREEESYRWDNLRNLFTRPALEHWFTRGGTRVCLLLSRDEPFRFSISFESY